MPVFPKIQLFSSHFGFSSYLFGSLQDDLNLEGPVMENINRAGYTKPTPVQKHALPIGEIPEIFIY